MSVISTFASELLAPVETGSIVHNPFIIGNEFVVLSYYHDGVQIFNIDEAQVPFRAGYYDTFDNTDYSGFLGAWGVYPFLPSGHIIASDIRNGLFTIKTDFPLYPCSKDVFVKGAYENTWNIKSDDILVSEARYLSGSLIGYEARQEISLNSGFEIAQSSEMTFQITDTCDR